MGQVIEPRNTPNFRTPTPDTTRKATFGGAYMRASPGSCAVCDPGT